MPAHAAPDRHRLLVAADTDIVPVFEPLVELTDYALVTDQIAEAPGLVPIGPHVVFRLIDFGGSTSLDW